MTYRSHRGFTLTEMLVATAVGMAVVQMAFTSFIFIQKYIRRIERISATNQVAQSALMWSISKPTLMGADFPNGEIVNKIGCVTPGLHAVHPDHYEIVVKDYSNPAYIHWFDKRLQVPKLP